MPLFNLPGGVYDVMPEEQHNLEQIKQKLQEKFASSGCQCIKTPGIEYFDNFTKIKGQIPQEKMFKITDFDGKILVVRPDITLSAARIAATKLEHKINKLCYFSSIYQADSYGLNLREVYQAGVEFLGTKSDFADAEIIALAIESLKAVGLDDFIIDIGHTGFFAGILSGTNLSDEDIEDIRSFINRKDLLSVELLLKKRNASGQVFQSIMQLPSLFGTREAITRASILANNAAAKAALESLCNVYDLLCKFGYEKYISIDLGTVKRLSYYSGIVFTGMCSNIGSPVLSGGRYDNLAAEFGKDIPAVGFAIGLKRVITVLERQGKLSKKPTVDVIVAAFSGFEEQAYNYAIKLRDSGKIVELFTLNAALCKEYASSKGIKTVKIFGDKND